MSVERIIPGGRSDAQARLDRDNERGNRDGIPVLLESTLPPTPLKDLLAADGASVCVLSADRVVHETVQQAGGEQYPVYKVEDWSALCADVRQGRCGIALVDVESISGALPARIAELRALSKTLVVLVAAARADAQDLIGLLSDRKIHRLLMKPPALGITRLLLESAVSRYLELRSHKTEPVEDELADIEPSVQMIGRWPTWAIAVAIGSLALGVALVAAVSRFGAEPEAGTTSAGAASGGAAPAAAAMPVAPTALENPQVAELMVRATLATAAGRLANPTGDSALDHYRAVLAIAPDHPDATAGLETLRDTLYARAEAALLDEMPEEAAALLEQVGRAEPDSPRLAFLRSQHQRLTDRLAAEAAEAEAVAAAAAAEAPVPPSELDSLLAIAELRLQRGQVFTPDGDSARAYLERAELLGGGDPRVATLRLQIANAIAASAGSVLQAGDVNRAATLLEEADQLGASDATLDPLEARIADAREQSALERQATLLSAGLERMEEGLLVEPAEDSALYYLGALRAENPEHPELAEPWQRLSSALAEGARQAIEAANWAQAERWIVALEGTGQASGAADLRRALAVGRTQEAFLATPSPSNELELLQAVPPEYPEAAVRNDTEGWVEIEFIVGRDGVPRELAVRAAEPEGRFEEAALAAVAQYRYAPFEQDGEIYERRVGLRIRFALEN
jgi:protein TonB